MLLGLGLLLYSIAAFYDLYPIERIIFVICKLYICVQKEANVCSLLLWIFFWIFSCICHKNVVPLHWIWKWYYQQLLPLNLSYYETKFSETQTTNAGAYPAFVCGFLFHSVSNFLHLCSCRHTHAPASINMSLATPECWDQRVY